MSGPRAPPTVQEEAPPSVGILGSIRHGILDLAYKFGQLGGSPREILILFLEEEEAASSGGLWVNAAPLVNVLLDPLGM